VSDTRFNFGQILFSFIHLIKNATDPPTLVVLNPGDHLGFMALTGQMLVRQDGASILEVGESDS
jgi:hypothetical protein